MKTAAIFSSLTVVGSIAYATGQGGSGKQPSAMPSEPEMTTHEVAGGTAESLPAQISTLTAGVYDACDTVNIVSSTPHFFATGCDGSANIVFMPILPLSPADVNGDSVPELYQARGAQTVSACATTQTLASNSLVWRYSVVQTSDGTNPRSADVAQVSAETIKVLVPLTFQWAAQGCGVNHCGEEFGSKRLEILSMGWLDCDNDGDLDLVCTAKGYQRQQSFSDYQSFEGYWICGSVFQAEGPKVWFWLENTGFQHTNPIAADLNRDGQVDGADLGLLLVSWGETQ
jgi:hypothetical protein